MICIDTIAVIVKGGGDIGTGVAHRLFRCGFPVTVVDILQPTAVRRSVSFCEAVNTGEICVEGITAKKIKMDSRYLITCLRKHQFVPVIINQDKSETVIRKLVHILWMQYKKTVLVDAILAKRNIGTTITDADLVIGLGPGFSAGVDAHRVIETNRGQRLGRIIEHGSAESNTSIPGNMEGYSLERVLYAPASGTFHTKSQIGMLVRKGDLIGDVNGVAILTQISGIIRGLLKEGLFVDAGMKLGDIDPREDKIDVNIISDKARAIAGGVLEAIISFFYPLQIGMSRTKQIRF